MSETGHALAPEEIMAYLDGELASGRAAEAMTHLDRCPECQRLAGDLRRVSQELTGWQVEAPNLTAPPAVEAPRPSRRQWPWGLPRWAYFSAAAAGLIVLVVAIPRNVILRNAASPPSIAGDVNLGGLTQPIYRTAQQAALPAPPPAARLADQLETASAGPMIERTAQLTLTTRDFDQLRARIDAILTRHRGYVADLTVTAPESAGRSLNAKVRIPAGQLDSALAEFKQLGRVESESQNGRDVSKEYVDLVARLANARNTAARLTQLLAQRTGKLSDVLEVETELGRVQGRIEQMEAERKNTESQVAYADVQLNVSENYKSQLQAAPDSTLLRFRNAAIEGYRSMADGAIGLALFVIAYAPSALLWTALLFFPVRAIWRRARRNEP